MIYRKATRTNHKKTAKEHVKFLKNITLSHLNFKLMSFLLSDIFQVKVHASTSSNKDIKQEKTEEQNPKLKVIREEILEVSDSNDDEDETDDIKIVNEVRAAANDPNYEPKHDYQRELSLIHI